MKKWIAQLRLMKPIQRVIFIICVIALIAGSFALSLYLVGSLCKVLTFGNESAFYYAFNTPSAKPIIIVSSLLFAFFILRVFIINARQNFVADKDERGVNYMNDATFGSSRWMRENEVKNAFTVCDLKDTTTYVYGQLSDNGEKVVGYKKPNGATGSKSTILIASSGSGKSFTYVRNNIIQAVRNGRSSLVVTDPSGELYADLSDYCRSNGMDVKVLNLSDVKFSEYWNCLEETIDPDSGRIDATRLNEFALIYMENSSSDNKKDFWYTSALNLLRVVIAYTAYMHEESILNKFRSLYTKISGEVDDDFIKMTRNSFIGFPHCERIILKKAKENGYDENEVTRLMENILMNPSYQYNIAQVYNNLINFKSIERGFVSIPIWHPAHTNYMIYTTNDSENVRQSALQGCQLRFDLFTDSKIRDILSYDGIHLAEANTKRSAYFVITSDKTNATKPIASLFFSFLFKDAQDTYDYYNQFAKEKGDDNPCCDLEVILDEFFSLGVIQGSPENFATTMSNARKRGINISIIIQVYSQLEALYGEHIKDVIQGNCSTLLYMGGNDEETCRFISNFASGQATVLDETHIERGLLHIADHDVSVRTHQRYLLTQSEAREWKGKVLVVKQGEKPLEINTLPWTQHPEYTSGKITPTSIYSSIIPSEKKKEMMSYFSISDPDTYFTRAIKKLRPINESEKAVVIDGDFISSEELLASLEELNKQKETEPDKSVMVKPAKEKQQENTEIQKKTKSKSVINI